MKKYLFADKSANGDYVATELFDDLDKQLWNLEYGDVAAGEYQIWEYPSGKIFNVISDRVVDQKDFYGTPSNNTWLPEIKYSHTDTDKITKEYKRLVNSPNSSSILRRIFNKLLIRN